MLPLRPQTGQAENRVPETTGCFLREGLATLESTFNLWVWVWGSQVSRRGLRSPFQLFKPGTWAFLRESGMCLQIALPGLSISSGSWLPKV